MHEMSNAVQVLHQNWRALVILVAFVEVTKSHVELVAKVEPVFGYQDQEAFKSSIVWIETILCQTAHLGGSIPTV